MAFLRWGALLALAFWVGGLLTLGGFTASTLFDVLEARDPSGGRELAALVFGRVFDDFQRASWIAAGIVIGSLAARAALGPRPRWWGLRMWVAVGMLTASVVTVFVVSPRIETIRGSVPGPVANLPGTDERRITFGRWHLLSTGLMVFTLVAGAGLIWTESLDGHQP
jgi:hypothetical protein